MEYRTRRADRLIPELLATFPAILLTGPRAAGKTTTARRHALTTVRLDAPGEARAFHADPDAALRGLLEPVLLDEYQVVPELVGAVKRSVDADPRPGRYLLTGSVWSDSSGQPWPGTGRILRVPMFGLTVAEQRGATAGPAFLDRALAGEWASDPAQPDLRDYIDIALVGGFPDAVGLPTPADRSRWLGGYVDALVTRDIPQLEPRRDPTRLRRFLHAYALNSAGLAVDTTILTASGLNRQTGASYERLFTELFIAHQLPAWRSSRLKRLVATPKRYLVDASLQCSILGAGAEAVMRDGDLLGRVLDTFVASQLRAEVDDTTAHPRLHHLRDANGRREIDILAELDNEQVVAIEVKADAAPGRADARHLTWLRDELGDRFALGIVFHTGPRAFSVDDRVMALPISSLWSHPRG